MYKSIVVFTVLCGVALCAAYPYPYPQNAFVYYRSAYPMMAAYPQQYQQTHAMQYQQAMFQNQRLRNYRRSAASGVTAFAAGDNVATGTQLSKTDCRPAADPASFPSVQSFADAYPAEALAPENELVPEADEDAGGLLEPEPIADSELDFPAASEDESAPQDDSYGGFAPLEPAAPPQPSATDKRKKKVTVQLDSDEDGQADEEDTGFGTRRGGSARPASAGPMFPVTFGSTNGGAIAIANSYSTGKGGSATSHATAYGSPASVPEERRRAVAIAQQQQQQLQARNSRPAKLRTKH